VERQDVPQSDMDQLVAACQWCKGPLMPVVTPAEGDWLFCEHCDRPCELHKYCASGGPT
jgi:hypothetical protein